MINASKITDFKRNKNDLQEFALFSIAVSGKNAAMTARNLERFLRWGRKETKSRLPFSVIKKIDQNFDLGQLESIYGIAQKTSRFFCDAF